MKTIAVIGTFDTKGDEFSYVKARIKALGTEVLMVHVGAFEPAFEPDISNAQVARAAGVNIVEIIKKNDRAFATESLAKGLEVLLPQLYKDARFDGVIALGGSGGTALATPAMRTLPMGVPKLMVSTMASGNVAQYVGASDILMMPSIVDVAGLNAISKKIFDNAVMAIVGMVNHVLPDEKSSDKPLVAATMFGVTTPCINRAKAFLEDNGYEVLVFHATGTGGKTMESLIEANFFKGVLDITTTEWCDELFGGVLAAGEQRSEAAAKHKVPQVVSVGAMDMVNFGPYDTVPNQFTHRNLYRHNPTVTLMRTSLEENEQLGQKLAEKLNMATEKTALFIPLKGISMIDAKGQPFYGKKEDEALFNAIKSNLKSTVVEVVEIDSHINDETFAISAAQKLLDYMSNE